MMEVAHIPKKATMLGLSSEKPFKRVRRDHTFEHMLRLTSVVCVLRKRLPTGRNLNVALLSYQLDAVSFRPNKFSNQAQLEYSTRDLPHFMLPCVVC